MTVLWFVIWLIANNVGGHEPPSSIRSRWAATLSSRRARPGTGGRVPRRAA
jgi:hypothetical protein